MNMDGNTLAATASKPSMNLFERYLTLWVALCIVAGITLGHLMPDLFQSIGAMEVAKVNLPVAEAASREPFVNDRAELAEMPGRPGAARCA
jgi:hypothetical protein